MEDNDMYGQNPLTKPMTFGDWIKTLLLMIIPIVNIILLFIWAFSGNTNINKKNFAKAYLLLMLIAVVLYIIFFVIIFSAGSLFSPNLY